VCSRAAIARQTGLSRAAISLSVTELIDEGLVREIGTSDSTGGRMPNPVLIRLGGDAKLVVGVGYKGNACHFVLVNLDSEVINRLVMPDSLPQNPCQIVAMVSHGVRTLLFGYPPKTLLGVGVALSGQFNALSDMFASLIWKIEGYPLRGVLEETLDVPVIVLDNTHAAGLGGLWLMGRENREHLMYFYMGVGTGGAIISGRDLYEGRNHTAGEIGPTIIDLDGPDFGCHRGCREGFLRYENLRTVVDEHCDEYPDSILPKDLSDPVIIQHIAAAAEAEDQLALLILHYAATYVGIQTANMLNLFNPDEIIPGGPFGLRGERFAEMVSAVAEMTALPIPFRSARVLPGSPSSESIPLGAAAMIIRRTGAARR
jgi:predicted NBD/HSP70 family sugar kinase